MATNNITGVVVWEWLNEYGHWRPYQPHVSDFIEKHHLVRERDPLKQQDTAVSLSQADPSLAQYSVNLKCLFQVRNDFGTCRPMRRQIYCADHPTSHGVIWRWASEDSGHTRWHHYDYDTMMVIEEAHTKHVPSLDLSRNNSIMPYTVDLINMRQIRKDTGFIRKIERVVTSQRYMTCSLADCNNAGSSLSTGSASGSASQQTSVVSGARACKSGTGAHWPISAPSAQAVISTPSAQAVIPAPSAMIPAPIAVIPAPSAMISAQSAVISGPSAQAVISAPGAMISAPGVMISAPGAMISAPGAMISVPSAAAVISGFHSLPTPGGSSSRYPAAASYSNLSTLTLSNTSMKSSAAKYSTPLFGSTGSSFVQESKTKSKKKSFTSDASATARPAAIVRPLTRSQSSARTSHTGSSQGHSYSNPATGSSQGLSNPAAGSTIMGHVAPPPGTHAPTVASRYASSASLASNAGVLHTTPSTLSHPAVNLYSQQLTRRAAAFAGLSGMSGPAGHVGRDTTHLSNQLANKFTRSSSPPRKRQKTIYNNQDRVDQSFDEVLKTYTKIVTSPSGTEDCCICCESLASDDEDSSDVYELGQCKHMFHKTCLGAMYTSGNQDGSLQCPICKTIHGKKCGDCPPGRMDYDVIPHRLPGHEDCDTIQIVYTIYPGVQPGGAGNLPVPYWVTGFPRTCFLPNSEEGKKVLRLLIEAWKRRLTFTIGTSVTTGRADTVVWNEIHHKTELGSNRSGHGYPDPNYLDNVLAELAAQGVTDTDMMRYHRAVSM